MVKDVLQGKSINELISQRQALKEEIYQRSSRKEPINVDGPDHGRTNTGVEIISFVLRNTRFGDKLAEASEEKKRREMIAEADNYAADQEASRIRKLYAAYRDSISEFRKHPGLLIDQSDQVLLEFLNQQKWATAYEKNQKRTEHLCPEQHCGYSSHRSSLAVRFASGTTPASATPGEELMASPGATRADTHGSPEKISLGHNNTGRKEKPRNSRGTTNRGLISF